MTITAGIHQYPSQDVAEIALIGAGYRLVHQSESGGGMLFRRETGGWKAWVKMRAGVVRVVVEGWV